MDWLLELAVIGLLAATLFHALRLERALGVLKRDRAALEALVEAFNNSTRAAEQGIDRLRSAADGAGRQLSRQVDIATNLKQDLTFLTERGELTADRMERLIRSGRGAMQDSNVEPREANISPFLGSRDPVRPDRAPQPAPVARTLQATDEPEPRLRSQAERDLLKALRMAR